MIHSKWGGVKAPCVLFFCRDKTRHYGDPHHPQLLQIVSYGQGLSQQIVHFVISRQVKCHEIHRYEGQWLGILLMDHRQLLNPKFWSNKQSFYLRQLILDSGIASVKKNSISEMVATVRT